MFCATVAPSASAQMKWTDQGFAAISVGGQAGSHTLATSTTFDIYDEQAHVETTQKVGGGGLFDINGGYKVWRNLVAAIGYSRTSSKSDASVAASIPDPVFTDRPRAVTASAPGLKHSEQAINFMGVWMVPVTDKIDAGVSFGPSIISVKQDGTVFVGQDWIPDRDIDKYLKSEHDKNPARAVMLKADKRINFGKVRLVMKAANDAQFTTVGIMTQNQQAGEQIAKGKT